ncbi:hypothetical protein A1Q2_05327 [Trichosporon asahii var. asahii CBS 8904]|uniref:Uncharacterized protein n=2 Tax=Trichosporon asahii var. asahii TaxID=189963 RepID=K1VUC3_TRIAC|nr:hypothetical protein A1Q1_06244 [Trichosporon asahii var. asahii CBS 2479]EJT45300.1 hypothetical protein A1Q1_06244 [Trichosporon asahii var. asahii CBS 2479]EKD00358.1 hypothetical protein A1Q2_05327 [Trichosporon asahii var. asahii CBS 8904]
MCLLQAACIPNPPSALHSSRGDLHSPVVPDGHDAPVVLAHDLEIPHDVGGTLVAAVDLEPRTGPPVKRGEDELTPRRGRDDAGPVARPSDAGENVRVALRPSEHVGKTLCLMSATTVLAQLAQLGLGSD